MSHIEVRTRTYGWSKTTVATPEIRAKLGGLAPMAPPGDQARKGLRQFEYYGMPVPPERWGVDEAAREGHGVERVELYLLNGVLFTEVVFAQRLDLGGEATEITDHWEGLYEIADAIEAAVYASYGIDEACRSASQTPLTIGLASADQLRTARGVLPRWFEEPHQVPAPRLVFRPEAAVGSSWDGVVVFLADASKRDMNTLEFLFRLVALRWAVTENTKTQLYAVLQERRAAPEPSSHERWSSDDMAQFHELVSGYYSGLAAADPYYVAYAQSEIAFARALHDSWDMDRFEEMTSDVIDDLERVFRIQLERNEAQRASEQQARSELLNQILAWLSIVGVATMVAAVLEFVGGKSAEDWSWVPKALAISLPTLAFAIVVMYVLRTKR